MTSKPIDIHSSAPGLGGALSNFAAYRFILDGVDCGSMEGFLQSLKTPDAAEQRRIAALSGWDAYGAGQRHDWKARQSLFWQSAEMPRASTAYQVLLDRAYAALLAHSAAFRAALIATGDAPLTHVKGKRDPTDTVLTQEEMVGRLMRMRTELQRQR